MIPAGQLRTIVTIQTPKSGSDGHGLTDVPGWDNVGTRRANVRPLRAAEVLRADQNAPEADYIVKMRYTTIVDETCQLVWGDRKLEIVGIVDVDGMHVDLEIMCKERKGAAGGT